MSIGTWIKIMMLVGPKFKELLPLLMDIYDTIISNLETKLTKGRKMGVAKAGALPAEKFQECVEACVKHCGCTPDEAKQLCSTLPCPEAADTE